MNAESVWLVDPIDGTKSFVRECPFFSTQIALMRGGRFVLGVSCAPAYDELAWAERGVGAFLDGKHIHVSKVDSPRRRHRFHRQSQDAGGISRPGRVLAG